MPELPYFPIYAREELGDPALVTQRVEHIGALFLLRLYAWRGDEEPSLPDDEAVLAQWSRLGSRWPRFAGDILAQFSKKTDGKLYHSEWSRIWRVQLAKHSRRVAAGREGGIARAKVKQSHSNARAKLKQPELEPEPDRSLNGPLRGPVQAVLAPEARASADEARAAPGARPSENGGPGDDSSTGRAVDSAAPALADPEWRGNGPIANTIAEVFDLLRHGRAVQVPVTTQEPNGTAVAPSLADREAAIAAEEHRAIGWVETHPAVKQGLVETVARKWGTLENEAQLKRIWVSACVRAMLADPDASATNGAEKHDRGQEPPGVTP